LRRPTALVDILDLERIDADIFRGLSPETRRWRRVFGGQVAAQALRAAASTVGADRPVHSLHAYFLRPGDIDVPIVYVVDRTRDGRSFSARRVTAVQDGRVIFTLGASFHLDEPGLEHQVPMPEVPVPADEPPPAQRAADDEPAWPIEFRSAGARSADAGSPQKLVWMRARDALPADPLVHVCAGVYASDMTLLQVLLASHEVSWDPERITGASLDHAMWFHAPFRADEWLLYARESPAASGARGLAQGRIFRRDGRLAVSVVQEGLIRLKP
jgi:acyl-CoA thioesterase II